MNKKSYVSFFVVVLVILQMIHPTSTFAAWNKPGSQVNELMYDVTRGPDRFVAVGANGALKYSLDGSGGQFMGSVYTNISSSLNGIIYDGHKYVIVGEGGKIFTYRFGEAPGMSSSNTPYSLSGIAYGNGNYVATGQNSTVVTSTDGVTWTSQILSNTGGAYMYDVTYGDKFVTVGQYGKIFTSLDGVNWTEQTSNTSNYLNAVTYANGQYVAVGNSGTILTSPDGLTWTGQTSGATRTLSGITFGDGRFVVIGYAGTIMTSNNGVSWNLSNSGEASVFTAIEYGNNTFVMVGDKVNLVYEDSSVVYNGNGHTAGSVPSDSNKYATGTSAVVLDKGSMVRGGYTFAGWNTAANGSGINHATGATLTMEMDNVTLYAQWTLSPTYTVTYNGNGSTGGIVPADSRTYAPAASVTVLDKGSLVRTGYTFAGWNTAVNGSGTNRAPGATFTMASTNVILYAQWTLNPTYTIMDNGNGSSGGTTPTEIGTYETGATVTVLDKGSLVRSGYTFVGWNTAVDGSGTSYAKDVTFAMASTNVTQYAQWRAIGNSVEPTIPKVVSSDGTVTLPEGVIQEVRFENLVKVFIPAGSTDKQLIVTIKRDWETEKLLSQESNPLSGVYEITKIITEKFKKMVTISFAFDHTELEKGQQAAVFKYDNVKKAWLEVSGSKTNGNWISVEVNDFAKFAVLCIDSVNGQVVPCGPIDATPKFIDISGHWAETNIIQAVKKGFVDGYSDGTFKPIKYVTREEFAVMLMYLLNPQGDAAVLTFTDKDRIASWAQQSVAKAVQAGIIKGFKNGTFQPNAAITRAEMAMMLANAMKLKFEDNTLAIFADDKSIPSWAKGAVAAIWKRGIMEGLGAGVFNPNAYSTRAEAVTVLLRMLKQQS